VIKDHKLKDYKLYCICIVLKSADHKRDFWVLYKKSTYNVIRESDFSV